MHATAAPSGPPYTRAIQRALRGARDALTKADLLFLEAWEMHGSTHPGATLRAAQIRRANPELAAEIAKELKSLS
ncbi:MAG TPA: hypothetical protein VN702_11030 [Acetobacteraceae bacterium]|nr:hypothetical protein [Acetobacteraceae bacterium]